MSSPTSNVGSHGSQTFEESLTSQDKRNGGTQSPLWRSLYVLVTSPGVVSEHTITSVPAANNLRPLRGMGNNAEYWVNHSGELFTFKFPVTLDLEGQFDRTGPYFNLPCTGLDLILLKKMRAQFEV
ncbi:hypothetical protein DFJ58DRAFT_740174 [Suillus subalutaceus]|uniref:uncharacterized protein n=1 Tax=Suillus subalutaceus TaxID=48586 RepID=UPI001B86873D|nr:uncharacterized protein DFJ58DRAFT_740174 [Suillus subalutaceus]KAG1812339.1 hypothetical protein DFJ58DRAFT_740174 [Suillus subalutaceus]